MILSPITENPWPCVKDVMVYSVLKREEKNLDLSHIRPMIIFNWIGKMKKKWQQGVGEH